MSESDDYLEINRESWNKRTGMHVESAFYRNQSFMEGRSSLNDIELALLDDVMGKSILHLQCHFGQDTLSLSRLGAKCTGVDFSDAAIAYARQMNHALGLNARFICTDLYSLPNQHSELYDLVFTSYGTIGWLPNINRWAGLVAHSLREGGQFIMVDFHPVVWMFDDRFKDIRYRYFKDEAIVETEIGSYADKESEERLTSISWNHSLGEILSALIGQGITIESFMEYDYSPYNCFNDMVETVPGRYQIEGLGNKIPLVYSIKGSKK